VVGEDDPVGAADYGWIERAPRDTIWKMQPFEHSMHAGGASKNRIDIKILDLSPGNYTLRFVTDDSHSYGKFNAAAPDMTSLYGMVLVKLDPQNEALIRALLKSVGSEETITGSNITAIEIGKKYVWVAADESGFNRIDPETGKVQQFLRDPGQKNSLPFNEVLDIYEDPRGMIWLAGLGGLAKFDPHAGKYTTYTESDGLPTNLTISILPGDRGEMWIATENGLSQMVNSEALGKVTFINYNSSDGLGGDTFLARVAGKSAEGQFFFGGDHGLTTFKSFKGNDTPPPVILSNLLISNKSVLDMKENSPLDKDLFSAEQIQLSFDQNNLGFEFAALDYANPGKNQYAHMLKGYDKDWIYDNHNFANYTNLEPGEYEFMVRASNAYGVWNEKGKTLKISIMPPWWQTWWAYAGYVVVFALLIFLTIRYMQGRIRERERERSREKELQHAREIEKAYMELKETQNQLIQSEKMASLGELTAGIAHEIQYGVAGRNANRTRKRQYNGGSRHFFRHYPESAENKPSREASRFDRERDAAAQPEQRGYQGTDGYQFIDG
jgi:heme exporter protein D